MVCEPKDFIQIIKNIIYWVVTYWMIVTIQIKYLRIKEVIVKIQENVLVDMINGLSKTPYKINKDTLNFVNSYGIQKGIIINANDDKLKSFIKNPYK